MLQITDETEEVECEGKVSELVDCAETSLQPFSVCFLLSSKERFGFD